MSTQEFTDALKRPGWLTFAAVVLFAVGIMLTIRYAAAYPKMRINSVDPGFTATDFNQHRGTQTVEQGAEAIVRYALIPHDGPTGGFFDRNGAEPS